MEVNILGHPAYVSRLMRCFEVIGVTDESLILCGPAGCGKQVWLDYVIAHSKRNQGPVIRVDCAELAESDAVREIFSDTAEGFLNQAQGGTLLLDQIHHLPIAVQATLSKFLEHRAIVDRRTGEARSVDTRVLATAVEKEEVFPSLLYRFTYRMGIIPLAQRREDIPYLVKGLLRESPIRYIRYLALLKMLYNRWDGNVREFRNYLAQTIAYYQSSQAAPGLRLAEGGLFGELSIRYFQDIFAEETWYYDYDFEEDFRRYFSPILTKTTFRQEIIDEGLVIPLDKKDLSYLVLSISEDDFEEKALRMYRKFASHLDNLKSGAEQTTRL